VNIKFSFSIIRFQFAISLKRNAKPKRRRLRRRYPSRRMGPVYQDRLETLQTAMDSQEEAINALTESLQGHCEVHRAEELRRPKDRILDVED
jgi:hypothetical protein